MSTYRHLFASFKGGRWGSNGEAEARIPLKINISFILATHNNTPSYKQKQSAEGAFLVEELSAARRRKAHTTKKRKVKTLRLLLGWKMGFEPTTKNHHIPHIINKLQQQLLSTCKSGYKYVHNFLLFEQRYTKIRK